MSEISPNSLIASLYQRAQTAMEGLSPTPTPPPGPSALTPTQPGDGRAPSPFATTSFGPGSLDAPSRSTQPSDQSSDPAARLTTTARDFLSAMREAETAATEGLTGRADPQSVVMALAATELAVETAVTLRDKVVEAYQEILRMPV
ncbi:MAG: flagellar hook-basal body complex protein FliE [Pseudomonadota bacterium]